MKEFDGPDINFAKRVKEQLRGRDTNMEMPLIVCLVDDASETFIEKLHQDSFDIVEKKPILLATMAYFIHKAMLA